MNEIREARAIIETLVKNRFYAECPCCGEPFPLSHAGLFHLDNFTPKTEELYYERLESLKDQQKELRNRRKKISQTSETGAKAVNIGFVLERLAPTLKSFDFDRNDCRSLFDPIDYVIFEGLNKHGTVSRILFVDIKTGGARLQSNQKEIRSLIEKKHVAWDVYESEAENEI